MQTILKGITGVALLAAMAACGSGLSSATSSGTGGNGNSVSPSAISLGSGTGANFVKGTLALSSKAIAAGGSATITATLVDGTGTLYTTSTPVTFNSPCVSAGTAAITDSSGASNTTITANSGTAIATYVAKGCQGSDTITATATVNNQKLSATATLTVAAAALGSIQFVSATPAAITLKGMGGAGLQQTSTVVFTVKDAVGAPVSGANVTFALVSDTGGVLLSQTTGTSDANGNVQTIVQAGTHSGPVVVQASIVVSGQTISTTSSGLAIQSGIPSQQHFSLAIDSDNPEGFDVDGNGSTLTVHLADRFGNPVPDLTTVSFQQSGLEFGAGGSVQPNCQTAGGVCSVKWTSQSPRPTDIPGNQHVGFAYVVAYASGEESFTDVNADGVFDDAGGANEPFDDLSEIFAPSAEFAVSGATSSYVSGEDFEDFNNNGKFDKADGLWEGVNCQETIAGLCGTEHSVGVGRYMCIVMAGSFAAFTNPSPSNLTLSGPGAVTVEISDENGNVLPEGTVISVDATNLSGGSAKLSPTNGSSGYTVGDTSCAGSVASWPMTFTITVTQSSATTPVTGTVALNVKTLGGAVAGTTTTATITVL
jgi:hypothetical protein